MDRSNYIYKTFRETFWKIVKRKSTEEYKSLPYICTLLGSTLWTYYGIVTPGEYLVSTVNGFGSLVEIIYVLLFLIYVPRHLKVFVYFISFINDMTDIYVLLDLLSFLYDSWLKSASFCLMQLFRFRSDYPYFFYITFSLKVKLIKICDPLVIR